MSIIKVFRNLIYSYKFKFAKKGEKVSIGKGCIFSSASMIEIGNNCSIGPNSIFYAIYKKIIIKDNVMLGPHVTIVSGDHNIRELGIEMINNHKKRPNDDQEIIIEEDVWIGANVTILKGVVIGRGCVIAAGTIVNKSVPPYSIWGGIPGHLINIRFNVSDIIKHEEIIYPTHNRLKKEALKHIIDFENKKR